MKNEIIIATIGAIIGGVITHLFSLISNRRKEKREDRLDKIRINREAYQNRPEMQITKYRNYLSQPTAVHEEHCDVEVFVVPINNVSFEGRKKSKAAVIPHYKKEHLNQNNWSCVIYTLKNAGKTSISCTNIFLHIQRRACLFPAESAKLFAQSNVLGYSECYDKKVRPDESITLKICYHKNSILSYPISAPFSIGMVDDNGRCWVQPLFAPENKVYDSREVSPKEYRSYTKTDIAEECFRNPGLW